MSAFGASATRFETWQRAQLHGLFVEADLAEKHEKMAKSPFLFLRATYWRWAETVFEVLPDLRSWLPILSIGDTHVENFGTWRDVEGRLVWGANDFDDAAEMPWPLDLVRLAVSALLAGGSASDAAAICAALADGYRQGLAAPAPIVLERGHSWLRSALLLDDDERRDYWKKYDRPAAAVPDSYRSALAAALPPGVAAPILFPRAAGTGSLGKPRFVAHVPAWRGGPVLREAKALLPSAWSLCHGGGERLRAIDIACGAYRAADPHYRLDGAIIVRRLSPSSRKIEAKEMADLLLAPRMLSLMAREIANCHAGAAGPERMAALGPATQAISGDWLAAAAKKMAHVVSEEQRGFARGR